MYDLVGKRIFYYLVSGILIVPGIVFMIWSTARTGSPLALSIDYTGGTLWEMRFTKPVTPAEVRGVFVAAGYSDTTAFTVEDNQTVQVKLKTIDTAAKEDLAAKLKAKIGTFDERSYRSIGPSIGVEVSRAAFIAVIIASLGILLYIAWAFREVTHPFRYGACAVIALVHDVLVTISFVGIMNWLGGWEVDALFLTAILTVIGFSVNDTIVVFDRIRENLRKYRGEDFATVANRSLLETLHRSIGTQITVLLVLIAILVYGGGSLRQFMATMMVGMVSGTYSSIFNATALLVGWEERSWFGLKRKSAAVTNGSAAMA